ncbi:MAG: Uma2 family endonuclease [Peptococcaceae bacterium]|jgi:Uma2 family endonuclease|nr:Uma2 family endonuclease [Peptococcaceae bacterium]
MNPNMAYNYDDDYRSELINGKIIMMSPRPVFNHVTVASNIYRIFANYLKGKSCTPFDDGFDLYLTEKDHFVPDAMVVCDPNKIKYNGVHGAPDLVVEVLSPSTMKNDKGYKKDVYEQCGVLEYWLVDVNNKSVEQYLLQDGKFVLNDIYVIQPDYVLDDMSEAEKAELVWDFKCSLYDDLLIHLEDVFERVK